MAKYTQKQIEELAKMGVTVTPEGVNLSKETRLERIMRVQKAEVALSKSIPVVNTIINGSRSYTSSTKGSFLSPKSFTRDGIFSFTDQERYNQGLVTEKIPGYVYTTMDDKTKICRCCQDRKHIDSYSNNAVTNDLKMIICKDCDNRKAKTYKIAKEAKKAKSSIIA